MTLSEPNADKVIRSYMNFLKEFERVGQITDKNFNRIRLINRYIGVNRNNVRITWGDLFDEVYKFLDQPEIKLVLDEEDRAIKERRKKRKGLVEKQRKELVEKQRKELVEKQRKELAEKQRKELAKAKRKHRKKLSKAKKEERKKNFLESIQKLRKSKLYSNDTPCHEWIPLRNLQPIPQRHLTCFFDDESIFDDIMDERRAEGKGYSGAK